MEHTRNIPTRVILPVLGETRETSCYGSGWDLTLSKTIPFTSFVCLFIHLCFNCVVVVQGDGFSSDMQRVAFFPSDPRFRRRRRTFLRERCRSPRLLSDPGRLRTMRAATSSPRTSSSFHVRRGSIQGSTCPVLRLGSSTVSVSKTLLRKDFSSDYFFPFIRDFHGFEPDSTALSSSNVAMATTMARATAMATTMASFAWALKTAPSRTCREMVYMNEGCEAEALLEVEFAEKSCSPVLGFGSWLFETTPKDLLGVAYLDETCQVPMPFPGFVWTGYSATLRECAGPRYFNWNVVNGTHLVTQDFAEADCLVPLDEETVQLETCQSCLFCTTLATMYVWAQDNTDGTVDVRFYDDPDCTQLQGELINAPTDVCSPTTRQIICTTVGGCVYISGSCFQEVCPSLVELKRTYGSVELASCIAEDPRQKVNAVEMNALAVDLEEFPVELGLKEGLLQGLNLLNGLFKKGFSNPALFFCQADDFVQAINCMNNETRNVNSPWYRYCVNLTEEEKELGGIGTIASREQFGNFSLFRVAFDEDKLILTETDGLWRITPFLCTSRPWYNVQQCTDPLGTTCLYEFAGVSTFGLSQFTGYGSNASSPTCGVLATDVSPTIVNRCVTRLVEELSSDSDLTLILAIVVPVVSVALLLALYIYRRHRMNDQQVIARFKRKFAPGTVKNLTALRLLGLEETETPDISLVSTDVKGSTRLWEQDPAMVNRATHVHDAAIRRIMSKYFGYEVRTEGDSFLIAFHTAEDALGFCLGCQLELLTCDWPIELESTQGACSVYFQDSLIFRGMRVRMAIATGPFSNASTNALTKRLEYTGEVMERVKLLESFADGGQIVMDSETHQTILNINDDALQRKGKGKGMCFPSLSSKDCCTSLRQRRRTLSFSKLEGELCPVFMDLGIFLPKDLYTSDEHESFRNGSSEPYRLEVLQVLPRKILARAVYFETSDKFLRLQPGFFDAPMAREGFLCALERLKTGADPSPDSSAYSIVENEMSLKESAFTVCIVFSSMKITQASIFGNEKAEQYVFQLYQRLVRETLPLYEGYECQFVDSIFMLAFFKLESAILWSLQLQHIVELANQELEAHFKCYTGSKELTRQVSWSTSRGIPTAQRFLMTCREGLYFDVQLGLFRGAPAEVFPHGSSGRADYFGRVVNRAARFQATAYVGSLFLPTALMDEFFCTPLHKPHGNEGFSQIQVDVQECDPGSFQFKGLSTAMDVSSLIVCQKAKLVDVAMRPGGKNSQVRKEKGWVKTHKKMVLYDSTKIVSRILEQVQTSGTE